MLPSLRSLLLSLLLCLPLLGQGTDRLWDRPLDRDGLAPIQEAVRELGREVEYLQRDIITDLAGRKERILYAEADTILGAVYDLQYALKVGASREKLYETYLGLDRKLHAFLRKIEALEPEQRLVHRAAERVGYADEELHRVLATHATTEPRMRLLLERQARVLTGTARRLEQTAQFALGRQPGRAVLIGELNKLSEAVERFQKTLDSGANRDQLRRAFAAVNKTWESASREIQDLRPGENVYFLRGAGEMDRIHETLFRLLGMEGERPQLRIRT